jgi:hypothetical protein
VKLFRLRRPKASCSLSYADYRPKTKAVILWDTDHTKGRDTARKGNLKLEFG